MLSGLLERAQTGHSQPQARFPALLGPQCAALAMCLLLLPRTLLPPMRAQLAGQRRRQAGPPPAAVALATARIHVLLGLLALAVSAIMLLKSDASRMREPGSAAITVLSFVILGVPMIAVPALWPGMFTTHRRLILALTRLAYFALPTIRDPRAASNVLKVRRAAESFIAAHVVHAHEHPSLAPKHIRLSRAPCTHVPPAPASRCRLQGLPSASRLGLVVDLWTLHVGELLWLASWLADSVCRMQQPHTACSDVCSHSLQPPELLPLVAAGSRTMAQWWGAILCPLPLLPHLLLAGYAFQVGAAVWQQQAVAQRFSCWTSHTPNMLKHAGCRACHGVGCMCQHGANTGRIDGSWRMQH